MDDICKEIPIRNSPRIAALVGESKSVQYFIIVEQSVLCEVPSFQMALFIMFSAYYVFNLAYPKQSKNTLLFLQDFILESPDGTKRPATYLATSSDINRFKIWMSQDAFFIHNFPCMLFHYEYNNHNLLHKQKWFRVTH